MVTDYSEVDVVVFVVAVFLSTDVSYCVHDFSYSFYIIYRVDVFHDACDSFKSHSGVDVRMRKRMVFSVFIFVKLRENEVPNFEESVAVAARFTIRASAAEFFALVVVDFGVRTRRTDFEFPEVVFFSKFYNSFSGNSDFVVPNSVCFVVFFID